MTKNSNNGDKDHKCLQQLNKNEKLTSKSKISREEGEKYVID